MWSGFCKVNFEEWISNSEFPIEKFKKRIMKSGFQKVNFKSEFQKVSFEKWVLKSDFQQENFQKRISKSEFQKVNLVNIHYK